MPFWCPKRMTKQLKADIMLLFVTMFWGISYFLSEFSLSDMGPFTLNANRFLIAFAVAVIVAFPKLKNISWATIKYSILLGLILVVVYMGATFSLLYTSLSNAGFLCGLTVIFTPIFSCIIYKKLPARKLILTVCISVTGIALLTLTDNFSINFGNLRGDLLALMCAITYAIDLLVTERAVSKEDVNPFQLGIFQLGTTGLFNLILSFVFETPHLPSNPKIWASVLFLAVFCTGLAFIIQVVAQQYTNASHVGIIFSLETVFSGMVAFLLAGEVLTGKSYFGAFLMVASLFIMEIDFDQIKSFFKQ